MRGIVGNPCVVVGVSDGGAHTEPPAAGRRSTGTVGRTVPEQERIGLGKARWPLPALPAAAAGFETRGAAPGRVRVR